MRTCRHLKDFSISVEAVGAETGLPPWGAFCEDCAATVFEALEAQSKKIADSKPSGKSSRAVTWARIRRVLEDLRTPTEPTAEAKDDA